MIFAWDGLRAFEEIVTCYHDSTDPPSIMRWRLSVGSRSNPLKSNSTNPVPRRLSFRFPGNSSILTGFVAEIKRRGLNSTGPKPWEVLGVILLGLIFQILPTNPHSSCQIFSLG